MNIELSDKMWSKHIEKTKKLFQSTKHLAFQYRLINLALVTNIDMFRWGMKSSNRCTFCDQEKEIVLHMFAKCKHVIAKIWTPLKKWLYHFCFIELEICEFEIIFNEYIDSFPNLVNTLILITKQYIYAARCQECNLCFPELIKLIAKYGNIEQMIAKKNKKSQEFDRKWEIYNRV